MIDGRRIKPISYLKANASAILKDLAETGKPLVITQNGEGKAVLIDINEYEQQQEAMMIAAILMKREAQGDHKDAIPADDAFEMLREELSDDDK